MEHRHSIEFFAFYRIYEAQKLVGLRLNTSAVSGFIFPHFILARSVMAQNQQSEKCRPKHIYCEIWIGFFTKRAELTDPHQKLILVEPHAKHFFFCCITQNFIGHV